MKNNNLFFNFKKLKQTWLKSKQKTFIILQIKSKSKRIKKFKNKDFDFFFFKTQQSKQLASTQIILAVQQTTVGSNLQMLNKNSYCSSKSSIFFGGNFTLCFFQKREVIRIQILNRNILNSSKNQQLRQTIYTLLSKKNTRNPNIWSRILNNNS